MAGFTVDRITLDQKSAEAVLAVREAFSRVEILFDWLSDNPVVDGVDPLTQVNESPDGMTPPTGYGYTADEAYVIRSVFTDLHNLNVTPILDRGRRLTGLN